MKNKCNCLLACLLIIASLASSACSRAPQRNGSDDGPEMAGYDARASTQEYHALFEEYDEAVESTDDPLKYWNKSWFIFNDRFYFWFLKPFSVGYGFIIPRVARLGIDNFFENLRFPVRFFNTTFQGKALGAVTELGRFLVNTTLGVAGLWDPATRLLHWRSYQEDFDQTLGVWHIGKGCFLTWPVFGPSSIRGTFGLVLDTALNPATWASGGGVIDTINSTSLDKNPYESIRESAIDPYIAVRDAYVQNRKKMIAE